MSKANPFGMTGLAGRALCGNRPANRQMSTRGGQSLSAAGIDLVLSAACRNDRHGKLLLMVPSYDRSGALGFRCVVDAERERISIGNLIVPQGDQRVYPRGPQRGNQIREHADCHQCNNCYRECERVRRCDTVKQSLHKPGQQKR